MRMSRLIFATILVLAISTTFIFVKETNLGPRFQISNDSGQSVTVTVTRRNKSRNLGTIEAGSQISLTARDEVSMIFMVRYSDGREIESQPIYFTSGILVNLTIGEDGVDVKRDIE